MDNISIIGGGIGGLLTALCFEKLGIEYKLYERAEAFKIVGAGIWLSPNALQVFEWINPKLLREIQKSGNAFDRIMIANHKLKPISDSEQDFVKNEYGYTTMAIHRGVLQKILFSHIKADYIVFDKEFKQYSSIDNKTYEVEFADGTYIKTNAIIGADGINSLIRKQLFPKSTLRYSGQTCWRGVSNTKLSTELDSVGFTLWGQQLQFGVSKLDEDKTYWFAVTLSEPNEKDDTTYLKSKLLKMFSEFDPVVHQLIQNTTTEKIIRGDLSDLNILNQWHSGNICLIGDAAHSMTPDLGQGGAQAIEDAYYLSNYIHNSNTMEEAYTKFYNKRKSKVEKLVKQSRTTSKIAITSKPIEIIRNFILKYTPEKLMQKQMIALYEIDKEF